MASTKITNRIEQAILNHNTLKQAAANKIREANNKQQAADDIKQGFTNFLMNKVALVVLADDGVTPKHTVADAFTQNLIQEALDECDWAGLVDKYWDQVRGS